MTAGEIAAPTDVSAHGLAESLHETVAGVRLEALLAATNRFVRADDLHALAEAITDAIDGMFDPVASAVAVVRDDGGLELLSVHGLGPEPIEAARTALAGGGELAAQLTTGQELWSDAPGSEALRARLAEFGPTAGFVLPLVASGTVVGTITAMFAVPRSFDEGTRLAARSLAGEAGMAYQLLQVRDHLRRNATALDQERHAAAALLEVAGELASVTDPALVPPTLSRAARSATGATFAGVAIRREDTDGFRIVATDGLPPDVAERLATVELTAANLTNVGLLLGGQAVAGSTESRSGVLDGLGLAQVVVAPIVIDGEVWGAVGIAEGPDHALPPDLWRELVNGLASLGATAIARAEAVAALATERAALADAVAERTRQLREAVEELRVANQAKTDLLANVSHELRTPLTSIVGYADLLVAGLDGPLTSSQDHDARTIQTSSRHLLALIDDLIDISSIEAGRTVLRTEPVSIAGLLEAAIEAARPVAGQKGIRLDLDAGDEDLRVDADPARLRDIVGNLLSNAIKFTPPAGIVRVVATRDPDVTGWVRPVARIDVIDSGIGVADSDRDRIFEKFERLVDPALPGTGLGLSISRELARLHGGDLTVESTVGLGSRFTIRIPLADDR